jgi:hypothetical protein
MLRRNLLLVGAVVVIPVIVVVLAIRLSALGGGGNSSVVVRLAGPNVDVTQARGPQSEAAIAVAPDDGRTLVAGSNDIRGDRMRVYSSTAGGASWDSGPLVRGRSPICAASDPSVAIDRDGRQYFGFLGLLCRARPPRPLVFIASRAGATATWRVRPLPVARLGRLDIGDDRPIIAIDSASSSPHNGRLYVGWTRFSFVPFAEPRVSVVVSHSDDGGRRWSRPVVISRRGLPLEIRLAAGPDGSLYAVWRDSKTNTIYVSRSVNGGRTFVPGQIVAPAVVPRERSCHGFRSRIPAQPRRCVSPNPVVAVDTSDGKRRGRVYVTYGSTALNQTQDVYVAAYDPDLHPLLGVRTLQAVTPREPFRGPDQFLPASAVDRATGWLWVCYYSTASDRRRVAATYTCTASADGGATWAPPHAAATKQSDETVPLANRANGYGDYEGVAVFDGAAHPIWTDSRRLRSLGEEIFTTTLR